MSRAICVALVAGLAGVARAQPRLDPTAGRAVFTGAATANPTSIELDPAALETGTTAWDVYAAATAVIDQLDIHTRTLDLGTGALVPGPEVHPVELGPGGMVAIVHRLKEGVALGGMLRTTPVEMFPGDQPALQYQTLGGGERTYAFAFGGGIKIADGLYFGASLSWEIRHLHLRYARDVSLESGFTRTCNGAPCGLGNPLATEVDDVQVHSDLLSEDALSTNAGLVYQIAHNVYVGVAYHTTPGVNAVQNTLHGNMIVTRAPIDGGSTVHGGGTVYIAEPVSVDGEVRARLPDELELHVGMRWENLSHLEAYDVRGYGTALAPVPGIEWVERPRGFHDPVAVWGGVEQLDAGETWRFGGRLGLQTSALPDSRTSPMAIAPRAYTADLGVQLRLPGRPVKLQLSYGFTYYPTVHVARSSYDPLDLPDCMASGFDYSTPSCESARRGYAIATAAGDYSRLEHALRLAVSYEFY